MAENKKIKTEGEMILLQMEPNDIDFFNKLIEGYDNVALATTTDAKLGKVALWVTEYVKKDIFGILKCLPIPVRVLSPEHEF